MLNFKREINQLCSVEEETDFVANKKDGMHYIRNFEEVLTEYKKGQFNMELSMEEMVSILDEINEDKSSLQSTKEEITRIVDILIPIMDLIENFHLYAKESNNQALIDQSSMMWNHAIKQINLGGIVRIADENTIFDPAINTIELVVSDKQYANNEIVKVLKSGYIHQERVLRKSTVVVNSITSEDEATEKSFGGIHSGDETTEEFFSDAYSEDETKEESLGDAYSEDETKEESFGNAYSVDEAKDESIGRKLVKKLIYIFKGK